MKKYSFRAFALILLIIFSFAGAGFPGSAFGADAFTATNISAGNSFTLIITDGGKVLAWGRNSEGQLGDGTKKTSFSSVAVKNLADVSSISAGGKFSMALKKNGTVWIWGDNTYGQLGDGTTEMKNSPVQVPGLSDVIAVDAGGAHALALKKDGTLWAWGQNSYGQLGNGTTEHSSSPVQMLGLDNIKIKAIGAGEYNSYALTESGDVWAVGRYNDGELGNGAMRQDVGAFYESVPVQANISGVKDFSVGGQHVLALMNDLTVYQWGKDSSPDPVKVANLSKVKAIAAGGLHSLAIKQDGTLWAWGNNQSGQLGNGGYVKQDEPVQVKQSKSPEIFFSKATAIAGGWQHSIAIAGSGSLWAWGDNYEGALGTKLESGYNSTYPVSIGSKAGSGGGTTGGGTSGGGTTGGGTSGGGTKAECAKGSGKTGNIFQDVATSICEGPKDKTVTPGKNEKPWSGVGSDIGKNSGGGTGGSTGGGSTSGGSGTGDTTGGGSTGGDGSGTRGSAISAIKVAAGLGHTVALQKDGSVWAWGDNTSGKLGVGKDDLKLGKYQNYNFTSVPSKVINLTNVEDIAAGYSHSIALRKDGTVWAWGYNKFGQLGDGTNDDGNKPVKVKNLTKVKAIAAGDYFSLALKKDGTVWAWGINKNSQLGTTGAITGDWSNVPVQVESISSAKAIAAGASNGFAILDDGSVWGWGYNYNGEIGNGERLKDGQLPVQVKNVSNVESMAVGESSSLALLKDGAVWGWGCSTVVAKCQFEPYQLELSNISGVAAVDAGGGHALVLKNNGTVYAWGNGVSGQLGDGKHGWIGPGGTAHKSEVLEKTQGLANVKAIACGIQHSLAVKQDGTLWAWGDNNSGQCGVDPAKPGLSTGDNDELKPVKVYGP